MFDPSSWSHPGRLVDHELPPRDPRGQKANSARAASGARIALNRIRRASLDSAKARALRRWANAGAAVLTAFIIDFDSTIVRCEGLEVLAEVVFADRADADAVLAEIARLTDAAMAGEIAFEAALAQRLALLRPTRDQIAQAATRLQAALTASAATNAAFFRRPDVYVLSGGFHEMIDPVVAELGVPAQRVRANRFVFDPQGIAADYDRSNPLARSGGKAEAVRGLQLAGEIVVVGDGWTDYEIRAAGAAHRFYAFIENVERPRVVAHADRVARSFDDLLRQESL